LSLLIATRYPERVRIVLPVGTGVETTIYQRIINFEQVSAIEADPNFRGGDYYDGSPPHLGLALARRIAHKTFVSLDALRERARAEIVSQKPPCGWYEMNHPVESYMLHQGEKFVRRFDANTYLRILDAWQWFDLVAEAGARDFKDLFQRCRHQEVMIFSIDSDLSFPPPRAGQARWTPGANPGPAHVDHRALRQRTRCLLVGAPPVHAPHPSSA
jgi:homoserine O-acetyltransferase